MAKIIRKSSKLERDYIAEKNRAFRVLKNGAFWLVGVLLGLVSSLFGGGFVGFLGVAIVGFFVLLVSTVVIFVHIIVAAY